MALPLRSAAALLVGAGGAGAVTMLGLLLGDAAGLSPTGQVAGLAFALLLSLPMAVGVTSLLKPATGAAREPRNLAVFGALFWLGGLGSDLFNPGAVGSFVTAAHAAALLGGVALAAAGVWALPPRPAAHAQP
ncbi:MAG TPA: hypothetical protein VGR28_06130 [Candidatus Thermoplasmatota archaeon]|jgi:hypothetical protein|nr:hypothetical protein [Candidatus Thermoplasmatota archaeon]